MSGRSWTLEGGGCTARETVGVGVWLGAEGNGVLFQKVLP